MKLKLAKLFTFCVLIASLTGLASATQDTTINFTDCDDVDWAQNAINAFVANGSVTGTYYDAETNTGTFDPYDMFTRDQLAKVISVAYMLDDETTEYGQTYSDIGTDHWAYRHIEAVAEYMPGFSVPTSNMPVFYGSTIATRETIIVTVAKVLRTVDISDAEADAILAKFGDEGDISYQMRAKVANMVDKGVINGYEIDGKYYLYPQSGVTRAEAITILYRATYGDVTVKNVVYPNPITDDTFTVKGETDVGARVWVNNIEATVDSSGYFTSADINVDLDDESITVEIRAEKNSATNTQTFEIPINMSAPTINIVNAVETTSDSSTTISGNIKDDFISELQLYINNTKVSLDSSGNFSYNVSLEYGQNTVSINAVNKLNLSSTQELYITRSSDDSEIDIITNIPEKTSSTTISLNAKITNYEKVYINSEAISIYSKYDSMYGYDYYSGGYSSSYSSSSSSNGYVDKDGYLTYDWKLDDGANKLEIIVYNESGSHKTKTLTTNCIANVSYEVVLTTSPSHTSSNSIDYVGYVNGYSSSESFKLTADGKTVSLNSNGFFNYTASIDSDTATTVSTTFKLYHNSIVVNEVKVSASYDPCDDDPEVSTDIPGVTDIVVDEPVLLTAVYGNWSDWSTTKVTSSNVIDVETRQIEVSNSIYTYERWTLISGNSENFSSQEKDGYTYETYETDTALLKSSQGYYYYLPSDPYDAWYNEKTSDSGTTSTVTEYRSRTISYE